MHRKPMVFNELLRLREIKHRAIASRDISWLRPYIADLAVDLDMPICALTIVGKHFQHVKVSVGTDLVLMHRDHAFCSHTICQDDVMVVEDASKDGRFRDNPYVVDGPRLRFYAGAPIRTVEGHKLGAVCLMDAKPRTLSTEKRVRLLEVAHAMAEKLHIREQQIPISQLSIQELFKLINSETKYSTKDRSIELVNALYSRWDEVSLARKRNQISEQS